jgi:hypothetical protein
MRARTAQSAEGSASRFLTMSANGRFVAFDSPAKSPVKGDTNGDQDVFVRDRRSLDLR